MSEPCDSGYWATFANDLTGEEMTLSVLCEGESGHVGPHFVRGGPTWEDDE
jgi:hypothetical protein